MKRKPKTKLVIRIEQSWTGWWYAKISVEASTKRGAIAAARKLRALFINPPEIEVLD